MNILNNDVAYTSPQTDTPSPQKKTVINET